MPSFTICQQARTKSGFTALLSIEGKAKKYDIAITDPFDPKQEQELEFYFEEWIRFPFDQQVIAKRAAKSIEAYGHDLFEQVFGHRNAYSAYVQARQEGLSDLHIKVEGDDPEFHAIHWEALKDPELPRPFAVDCVVSRQRLHGEDAIVDLKPSATMNCPTSWNGTLRCCSQHSPGATLLIL